MHVVFRESHGLEETATPFDPAQDPADLVVLSFSDSDLGAVAAGWHRGQGRLPSLRLCNWRSLPGFMQDRWRVTKACLRGGSIIPPRASQPNLWGRGRVWRWCSIGPT